MFYLLDDRTKMKIIEVVRLNGRRLRWIGAGLCVFSALAPWLLILDIVLTTFLICFVIYFPMVLGMGLSIIGLLYDNFVDMSK